MLDFLFILAIAALCGAVFYFETQRRKRLEAEGKIVKRAESWWGQESTFITRASYEAIRDNIDVGALEADGVHAEPNFSNSRAILLQSGKKEGWTAALLTKEPKDGLNQFVFSFQAWRSRRGVPQGLDRMNMALTAVEKAVLAADPQATVTTKRMQIKSKVKLF